MTRRAGLATTLALVGALAACGGPATPSPAVSAEPGPTRFYLSLGDSLAQGVQPSGGRDSETSQGYPDQLLAGLRQRGPALRLVKLGCPGETTATMISGGVCRYPPGSQLARAADFLRHHRGGTALVTLDIGANDLNPCMRLSSPTAMGGCAARIIPAALANLARILRTLRSAGGGVRMIGMTYYDPELAAWLLGSPGARALARASVPLLSHYDQGLTAAYLRAGARVANVFGAFRTQAFQPRVTLPPYGSLPTNVAYLCTHTWLCGLPPNEHANRQGYGVIAASFLRADPG